MTRVSFADIVPLIGVFTHPKNARTHAVVGRFACRREVVAMTTFAKPAPLTRQITIALCALREARRDGDATRIYVANRRFCDKVDLLPTARRTLAETFPELDARLRVEWK